MGPRPDAWRLADHELEPRIVAASDRTDSRWWKIGHGWPIDTAAQSVGFSANAWGHNQAGWPLH